MGFVCPVCTFKLIYCSQKPNICNFCFIRVKTNICEHCSIITQRCKNCGQSIKSGIDYQEQLSDEIGIIFEQFTGNECQTIIRNIVVWKKGIYDLDKEEMLELCRENK